MTKSYKPGYLCNKSMLIAITEKLFIEQMSVVNILRQTLSVVVALTMLVTPLYVEAQSADIEVLTHYQGEPASFRVTRRLETKADEFFTEYAQVFGLSDFDAMRIRSESEDSSDGLKKMHLEQTHRGMLVVGAEYILTENEHGVIAGLGSLVPNLDIDPDTAQINLQQAQLAARQHTIDQLNLSQGSSGQVQGTPNCELAVIPRTHKRQHEYFRLGWRCYVDRSLPFGPTTVHVDAKYGTTLFFDAGIRYAWENTPASGTNVYNNSVAFVAQHENGTWRLESAATPDNSSFSIKTLNAEFNEGSTSPSHYFNYANSSFDHPNYRDGVTAHWGMERFLEYLQSEFGRNSWDNNGGMVTNYVNWFTYQSPNATYVGNGIFVYGHDLDGVATPDTIGHEFGHAIGEASVDLVYENESGALSEGFSDAFGILAENAILGSTDWILGADVTTQSYRDVAEPWIDATPSPRAYLGVDWIDLNQAPNPFHVPDCGITPNRHCHKNGGVFRRWFYLLTIGENGWVDNNISNPVYLLQGLGIGFQQAGKIVYRTLTEEIISTANFSTIRESARHAADRLYGGFSTPVAISEIAWGAVGVGPVSFTKPVTTPMPGAVNVFPWPAELSWQPGIYDNNSWQIQIAIKDQNATNDQFKPQDMVVNKLVDTNYSSLGETTADLKSNTEYVWRVRSTDTEEKEWWHEHAEFKTKDMTPIVNDPIGVSDPYHPWRLPFRFTAEPEAEYFDIAVFGPDVEVCPEEDGEIEQFAVFDEPTWYKSVTLDEEEPDKEVEITVPKDSVLSWQIRAKSDAEGTHKSEWSDCYTFSTSDPKPVLVHPIQEDPNQKNWVEPWPVVFEWEQEDVRGAQFLIEVTGLKEFAPGHKIQTGPLNLGFPYFPPIFKHSWPVSSHTIEDHFGHTTESPMDLPGSWEDDEVDYNWQITDVLGPPWGTDDQPETEADTGLDSDEAHFFIYGDNTAVQAPWPSDYQYSTNQVYEGTHDQITYTWQAPVAGGDEYAIQVWSIHGDLGSPNYGTQTKGEMLSFGSIVSSEPNIQSAFDLTAHGPFSDWDSHIGFLWQIIAFKGSRERGQVGVVVESDYYPNIGPPYPIVVKPKGVQDVYDQATIEFGFHTPFAKQGYYEVTVWNGSNCSGNPVHNLGGVGGASWSDANHLPITYIQSNWGINKTWSWKGSVRGWPSSKSTLCTNFKSGKPPVPAKPFVPPSSYWGPSDIPPNPYTNAVARWTRDPHATYWKINKYDVNHQLIGQAAEWNQSEVQTKWNLFDSAVGSGLIDPNLWLGALPNSPIADNFFYTVTACNAIDECSPESDKSAWISTTVGCGTAVDSGGTDAWSIVEMGAASGTAMLDANFFTIPDRMRIYHGDSKIYDSSCSGGTTPAGGAQIEFDSSQSTETTLRVFITANCASWEPPWNETWWEYTLSCPE